MQADYGFDDLFDMINTRHEIQFLHIDSIPVPSIQKEELQDDASFTIFKHLFLSLDFSMNLPLWW